VKATRVGIELSPTACRIVELDGPADGAGETRVRSFAVLPASGPQTREALEGLRRRRASVVVWSGRTVHRQVMVTNGTYESMRAEAMAAVFATGMLTNPVWADISVASPLDANATHRPVLITMASAADMADALHPLREAGIRLSAVTTPAAMLGSLARWRRVAGPGVIEPYVAFDEQATCIALVRGGVLLAARELPWGYVQADYAGSALRARDDIATRLGDAIDELVASVGGTHAEIGQVCVCGGLPDLRSMSATLRERLDKEVEPLDFTFGIDAAQLPPPVEALRERGAELRLAWAAAAEWPPAINLLRARRRHTSTVWLARAAVIAGAAAGLGSSWWLVEHGRIWPARHTAAKTAQAVTTPAAAASSASAVPMPAGKEPVRPLPDGEEPTLPLDAALRTILFSPDRPLAIVDGRVIGVGDEVGGARVVQITAVAVMLRDGQGRLRRLTLAAEER
jgi:hypothetical protein